MAQHRADRIDTAFMDRNQIGILLNGHWQDPHEEYVGTTPTLSIRPGVVCKSGERIIEDRLGRFRIFRIDGDTYTYSPSVRFCKEPTAPYQELQLNLTLSFKKENDGQSKANEAVLTNDFDIDLPECNVRFVMAKGKYKVSGGTIHQIIETSRFSVLDVRVDMEANSSKSVKISKK
jgi:hypothetical protein